jgi:hypothetical protein
MGSINENVYNRVIVSLGKGQNVYPQCQRGLCFYNSLYIHGAMETC